MLAGTNSEYIKAYNRRIVLETIRRHGPLSRADIARHTSLTHQTVSNIVGELVDESLVVTGERRTGGRGQPPVTLQVDPSGAHAVGFSLDQDHLSGVLVDLGGAVLERVQHELDAPSPQEALDLMHRSTTDLLARRRLPLARLRGVGVALPGQIQVGESAVTIPANFPGWQDVRFEARLAEMTGQAVFVENDAVAAAIGERWHGSAIGVSNFLYLYFGIGIGAGLFLGGQPFRGNGFNAGKVGHIPVEFDGRPCSCGNRGCLERYASIGALSEALVGPDEVLHPAQILARYRAGDAELTAWLDEAGRYLAQGVLAVENLLDPEAILMGGRFPEPLLDELLKRVAVHLGERRMRGKPVHPQLSVSTLGEHAAALGAATLPLYQTLAPSQGLLLKQRAADPGSKIDANAGGRDSVKDSVKDSLKGGAV